MKDIKEYMSLSYEERTKHLDLSEPCHFRGTDSLQCRGLLAYILDTTVPYASLAHCCHACHNGDCSNPKHLYWGTPKENHADFRATEGWSNQLAKISAKLKGENNPNFGMRQWNNVCGEIEVWQQAQYIFDEYFSKGWDFSKYGQGQAYFRGKYNIGRGPLKTMLRMFNGGWIPNADPEWIAINN